MKTKTRKDRDKARANAPKPTAEMSALLRKSGSLQPETSRAAVHELASAMTVPMRQGVLYGNIYSILFTPVDFDGKSIIEFPLDFLAPGQEKNHVAYTVPNHGRIPERHIEGDVVRVSTYEIASSIDWLLKYARDARWDVFDRAMAVLNASFVKKLNDDAFHTVLASALDRNIVVYDSLALTGTFTKRLISLLQQVMRRNNGGNTTSLNRGRLTDIFMSPEALEDIRNWSTADVDEFTRREIFQATDGTINRIFGVNLHDLDEFGVGQMYQQYYTNDLAGTMGANDQEIVLGMDLASANNNLLMPVREPLQIFEDDNLHRQRRAGFYGWTEIGFYNGDNRNSLLGSL